MLLAIDVGNTHTVLGLYRGRELVDHWRISTAPERTADEMGVLVSNLMSVHQEAPGPGTDRRRRSAAETAERRAIDSLGARGGGQESASGCQQAAARGRRPEVDAAILSSVVPPLTDTLVLMVERYFGARCRVVGPGLKTGMPILYDNPREVGADRIVNAVAAYERFRGGLIIVDFGTATTFDVVTPRGEYLGGAICPGIGVSGEALFRAAARLPRVEFARPRQVVGRNTVNSIQSGLVFGYVGLVDGLVTRMRAEVDFDCTVVATGGWAGAIGRESHTIDHVDEHLTLEGLRLLHERNAGG